MTVIPSTIVKHKGKFTITFTDGSVLKNCVRRTYISGFCEWYVFKGHQYHARDLKRWGALVTKC